VGIIKNYVCLVLYRVTPKKSEPIYNFKVLQLGPKLIFLNASKILILDRVTKLSRSKWVHPFLGHPVLVLLLYHLLSSEVPCILSHVILCTYIFVINQYQHSLFVNLLYIGSVTCYSFGLWDQVGYMRSFQTPLHNLFHFHDPCTLYCTPTIFCVWDFRQKSCTENPPEILRPPTPLNGLTENRPEILRPPSWILWPPDK